jgi:hypothetical protein
MNLARFLRAYFISAIVTLIIAASPASAGSKLWIGDSAGNLGTVDVQTGTVTIIGNMSNTIMVDIAFSPMGDLYGIGNGLLYAIDPTTAQIYPLGNTGGGNSLTFYTDGTLYSASNALYKINRYNGASTLIGSGGASYASSGDMAFIGPNLYLSSAVGSDTLVRLNPADGHATVVGPIGFGAVYGLAYDGTTLYGVTGTKIIKINPTTGQGTLVLDYSGHGLGAAYGTAFFGEATRPCVCEDIEAEKSQHGSTYTLSVKNKGSTISGLAKIEVVELVPPGLTVTNINAPGWTCSPATPVVGPDAITCSYFIPASSLFGQGQSLPNIVLSTRGTPQCPNCMRIRLFKPHDPTQKDADMVKDWDLAQESNGDNNVSCVGGPGH